MEIIKLSKTQRGLYLMSKIYGRIIQPEGTHYMIQELHYSPEYAQDYVNSLIQQMEKYILLKQQGDKVAPLMTLEQMKIQLENMKQFKVVEEIHD